MNIKLFEQADFYRTAFSAFVNTAVDAVILIDESATIQLFNPAAEQMFGYSADEVLGENIKTLTLDVDYTDRFSRYIVTGQRKVPDSSGWAAECAR